MMSKSALPLLSDPVTGIKGGLVTVGGGGRVTGNVGGWDGVTVMRMAGLELTGCAAWNSKNQASIRTKIEIMIDFVFIFSSLDQTSKSMGLSCSGFLWVAQVSLVSGGEARTSPPYSHHLMSRVALPVLYRRQEVHVIEQGHRQTFIHAVVDGLDAGVGDIHQPVEVLAALHCR